MKLLSYTHYIDFTTDKSVFMCKIPLNVVKQCFDLNI